MKKTLAVTIKTTKNLFLVLVAAFTLSGLSMAAPTSHLNLAAGKALAACTTAAVPTNFGVVTQSVTVATAGTYRVWSRIKAPDTTNNSYYFKVDSGCNYDVGDSTAIPANTWKWVNYQDGNTATPIDVTLTAGTHTLTYTGKEANVQLDKIMLLGDTSCVPSDTAPSSFGSNCAVTDTTSPVTSITSPAAGATVSGTTTITANATDATGVTKVDFLVDGVVKGTDTTAAYSYAWDTTSATAGAHSLQTKAYDAAGNVGSSTAVSVTVSNTTVDKTPPTVSLTAPAAGSTSVVNVPVTINATAADNVKVTKVEFYVDAALKSTSTASPYSYVWAPTATGVHALTAKAYDAAGNVTTSAAVSVTVVTSTTPPTNGNGDVNGDGRVNAIDLSALISHDGQNYAAADFNHDGTVGAADMAILLAHWTW